MSAQQATLSSTPASVITSPWTCPFCALLCDGFEVAQDGNRYVLSGSDCPRARAGLQAHTPSAAASASPRIGAQPVDLESALAEAARRLATSRQPLFGGLATDVAGARALYPLAIATGAICDPAGGEALMTGLRALQDRGAFTTTLAEVRNRADLIIVIGNSPRDNYPEIWRRCGVGEARDAGPLPRELVFIGAPVDPTLAGLPGIAQRSLALEGDLFDTVATLAARVAQRRVAAGPELVALAGQLSAARYAVIVYQTAKLPAQGTLIVEAINRLVGTLNRSSRAAALPLSGSDGLASVNQSFAWLSGLPLRSRAGPLGLEHEPVRFAAPLLLAEGTADLLLWLSTFGPEPAVPATSLPTLVIGHPDTAIPDGAVFIPVATPGIGSGGHLFRSDGGIVLPLHPLRADALPTADAVLKQLTARIHALRAGISA